MDVVLLAASGLAREVISSRLRDITVVGVLDDDPALLGTTLAGVEVLGDIDSAAGRTDALLVCVGSGTGRRRVVERLRAVGVTDARYATAIDASVHIPSSTVVGAGSILLAGVVTTADILIGRHVVVMPHVTLTHDDRIDDFATFAAGVSLGGGVHIREAAYLGMNASVRQGLTVGEGATIGMGAAVVSDIPSAQIWAGVPARPLNGSSA